MNPHFLYLFRVNNAFQLESHTHESGHTKLSHELDKRGLTFR